jgi:hypothetical protein
MCHFDVCTDFCIHSHASGACAFFQHYMNAARARVPCIFFVHADFIAGCILLDLLEMHFWSMSELMSVLKMLDYCNHLWMKFR